MGEQPRLLSMRILQNFVRQTKGNWSDDQWKQLVQRVRRAGFEKVSEDRLKELAEDNRERWLSGDNSVGPPPAGKPSAAKEAKEPAPAAAKKRGVRIEEHRVSGRAREETPESKGGKEMPAKEEVKREAPRPAPAAGGGVKAAGGPVPVLSPKDLALSTADAQEKHQRRVALIKRNQDLVKESVDTEVEIRRLETVNGELSRQLDNLGEQRSTLDGNRKRLQADVDQVGVSALRKRSEDLAAQRSSLEEQVGRRKKERSEHVAAIARFKAEREGLIS